MGMNFLQFKNEKVFRNYLLKPHHANLIELEWWWLDRYGEAVVTSAFRYGDTGVHGTDPLRGIDFRSWIYSNPQAMVDEVNSHFVYDPNRPNKKCVILHNIRNKGIHLHLQVCDRTVKI